MNGSGEPLLTMSQGVFTFFDAISLVAAIASLVLSIVAIWLAIAFKRDADEVNAKTAQLLIEIKSDAKSITQGVMAELRAYGDSMRGVFIQNKMNAPRNVVGEPQNFEMKYKPVQKP